MGTFSYRFLVAGGVVLLVSEFASGHRQIGSCSRYSHQMYPRRYDYHRTNCHRPRRRYNVAMGIIDDLIYANMNSLARQQKRSVGVQERQLSRYKLEDFGNNGLEISLEVHGLDVRDINLEVFQKDGSNIISVKGTTTTTHKHGLVATSKFSQILEINDKSIDLEEIHATVSSGVLRIGLPRKNHDGRKRRIPIVTTDESSLSWDNPDHRVDSKVPDPDRNLPIHSGASEPIDKQTFVATGHTQDSYDYLPPTKGGKEPTEQDDFFISEEEDIV